MSTENAQQPNTELSAGSAKLFVTGSLPFVRFASENNIKFFMDHRLWQNVPDDVNFHPIDEYDNGLFGFVGDGYGILPKHNLTGKYGSGSIHIHKSEIPELVEWCRANFL